MSQPAQADATSLSQEAGSRPGRGRKRGAGWHVPGPGVGGHAPPKMWTPSQGCRYSLIRTAPPEPALRPLASPLNASPRPWTSNSHHKAVKAKSSCLSPSKCSLPPHFPTFTGQTFDFRVCVSNHPCQFPGGLLPTGTPASQNPRSSRDRGWHTDGDGQGVPGADQLTGRR